MPISSLPPQRPSPLHHPEQKFLDHYQPVIPWLYIKESIISRGKKEDLLDERHIIKIILIRIRGRYL
jgi:hypothetical protein